MVKDAINKVQFDLHCNSEATAKRVQKEISDFTWSRINRIIDDLLGKANSNLLYKIDRIELDLGDIALSALSSPEVLEGLQNKFEEALQRNLRHLSSEDRTVMTGDEADWKVLKCYLLTGDIPWWVDKSQDTNIRKLARRISQNFPQRIIDLTTQHGSVPGVSKRLMILQNKNINYDFEEQLPHRSTSTVLFKKMLPIHQVILNKLFASEKSGETILQRAITEELVKDHRWIESAGNFSSLTPYQRRQLKILKEGDQRALLVLLKNLPLNQLGHLLFAPSAEIRRSTGQNNFKTGSREIAFKKWLFSATPVIRHLFKQWKEVNKKRAKSIRTLAVHPGILRHDLLSLIAGNKNPFADIQPGIHQNIVSVWTKTHKLLSRSFGDLTEKQRLVYQDLTRYGYSGRNNELDTMKQLLQELPSQSIKLISFLADLINEQIVETEKDVVKEGTIDFDQGAVVIENAGLCLIASYLPSLFKELGYLEDKIFRTRAFAIRAVHLLEYIVTGKRSNPEYRLQLNKILCGCGTNDVVGPIKRFGKKEVDEADELIRSVVRNWKILNNTSVQGFRDSFLKRKGIVTENETSWTLQVEKKSYDVLLNSLPWSFNMIKLPWMKKMIGVEL